MTEFDQYLMKGFDELVGHYRSLQIRRPFRKANPYLLHGHFLI